MLDVVDGLLIEPIRQALLLVLTAAHALTGSWGWSLILLAIVFTALLMPAYHWAEKVQRRERLKVRAMAPKTAEFKQVFSGQERHLMMRALYRHHDYHPASTLRSLAPLAIQIPFFVAAFGLLSDFEPLKGVPFLFIDDLGRPDGLLFGINVLPLVMTAINLWALFEYSRQTTRSEMVQGLAVALIFLVLLYASPAGLVLYWTMNNLLSVAKSAFYGRASVTEGEGRIPARSVSAGHATRSDLTAAPSLATSTGLSGERTGRLYVLVNLALFAVFVVTAPLALTGLEDNVDGLRGYFVFYAILAAAVGLAWALVAFAAFRIAGPGARRVLNGVGLFALLAGMGFGLLPQPDAGVLDNFVFSKPEALASTGRTVLLDVAVLIAALVGALLLLRYPSVAGNTLTILLVTAAGVTALSVNSLVDRIYRKSETAGLIDGKFYQFSKTEPNVILMFVDGAMTGYLPDILDERPHLRDAFPGFEWYSNVVSTGNRTINGLPAVFGGFDYTVSAINARSGGDLTEKVSDAYRLYVETFSQAGYDVLYSDPFWYGLERKGDCERFNAIYAEDGIGRCIHAIGRGVDDELRAAGESGRLEAFVGLARQYLAIAAFRMAPHAARGSIYDDGEWLGQSYVWKKKEDKYLANYFSLTQLGALSGTQADRPTFTFLTNEITRAPLFLDGNCIPGRDLTAAFPSIAPLVERYGDADTAQIYQTTACTIEGLAGFVRWLRDEGIYDNTMLVIASDHGWVSRNPGLFRLPDQIAASMFQAFLMIKPFGADAPLRESREFIANANVPGIICETLGGCEDPVTGKRIVREALTGSVLLHMTPWQPSGQLWDRFVIEGLWEVRDDITKPENWTAPDRVRIADKR